MSIFKVFKPSTYPFGTTAHFFDTNATVPKHRRIKVEGKRRMKVCLVEFGENFETLLKRVFVPLVSLKKKKRRNGMSGNRTYKKKKKNRESSAAYPKGSLGRLTHVAGRKGVGL